ncbi:MAG TPA: flagellar hook-length control protein FliK [Phycisphaerae bacterium]|nr:flagellar hook-length control protein FliK [Phycisphaerae bacterium]
MGPASIAAEVFRPQTTDSLAAQSRKAAADDHRFEDYLEEAHGAEDARQGDEVEKRDEPSASQASSDDDDREPETLDASSEAAVQAAVAQTIVVDAPQVASSDVTSTSADGVEASVDAPSAIANAFAEKKDAGASATPIASTTPGDAQAGANDNPLNTTAETAVSTTDTDATSADIESRANAALREAAAQPIESSVDTDADDSVATRPVQPNESGENTSDRVAEDARGTTVERAARAAVSDTGKDVENVVPRESVHQRLVRDALESRRVDPANEGATKAAPKQSAKDDAGLAGSRSESPVRNSLKREATTSSTAKPGVFAARLEAASGPGGASSAATDTASIRTGVGDSAAVSALRFLISENPGASGAISHTPSGGTGATTTNVAAPSTAGAAANTIVSDLLTNGADRSGGVDNLVRELNASGVPGRYQATLRLDPPSLGTVRIQLNLQHEGLSIQVDTQSRQTSKLIESKLNDLREALSAHGIRVERADVVTKTPENSATSDRHENSQQHYDQSAPQDADYQLPRDAQDRNDSSWQRSEWQGGADTVDAINELQNDTTQGVTDRDVGGYGFAPGAVNLVA